jgi:hypothetical protein
MPVPSFPTRIQSHPFNFGEGLDLFSKLELPGDVGSIDGMIAEYVGRVDNDVALCRKGFISRRTSTRLARRDSHPTDRRGPPTVAIVAAA